MNREFKALLTIGLTSGAIVGAYFLTSPRSRTETQPKTNIESTLAQTPQRIDSPYATIDTIALKRRLNKDYIFNDVYLSELMQAAVENNPEGKAIDVLRPYNDVSIDLYTRIIAREDTLKKAREAMAKKQ